MTRDQAGNLQQINTPKINVATELLPKEEVEELVLEEVPDVSYEDVGGLDSQIEQITDAVELPFVHHKLFADYRLRVAQVLRDYGMNDRAQAPDDSRKAHG